MGMERGETLKNDLLGTFAVITFITNFHCRQTSTKDSPGLPIIHELVHRVVNNLMFVASSRARVHPLYLRGRLSNLCLWAIAEWVRTVRYGHTVQFGAPRKIVEGPIPQWLRQVVLGIEKQLPSSANEDAWEDAITQLGAKSQLAKEDEHLIQPFVTRLVSESLTRS